MKVQCQWCKQKEEKENMVRIDDKNFHKECGQLFLDRRELYNTITKIFQLKAPGPVNLNMVKSYYENKGFTFKGMTQSLTYFYEVLGNKIEKANERIGIIPFVYDTAQEYYKAENARIEKIIKKSEVIAKKEHQVNYIGIEDTPQERRILINNKNKADNPFDFVE